MYIFFHQSNVDEHEISSIYWVCIFFCARGRFLKLKPSLNDDFVTLVSRDWSLLMGRQVKPSPQLALLGPSLFPGAIWLCKQLAFLASVYCTRSVFTAFLKFPTLTSFIWPRENTAKNTCLWVVVYWSHYYAIQRAVEKILTLSFENTKFIKTIIISFNQFWILSLMSVLIIVTWSLSDVCLDPCLMSVSVTVWCLFCCVTLTSAYLRLYSYW